LEVGGEDDDDRIEADVDMEAEGGVEVNVELQGRSRARWACASQAIALIDSSIPQSAKCPGRTRYGKWFDGSGALRGGQFGRVRACSSSMRCFHCCALDAVKRSLEEIWGRRLREWRRMGS
jgi:hypothetical protein